MLLINHIISNLFFSHRDNKLMMGKNHLRVFMLGTSENLNAKENVYAIAFMENKAIEMAKEKHFKGILTTNTNPLMEDFGKSYLGYQTMLEYHISRYVDGDGNRPFASAHDTQKVVVMYKPLK